MHFFVSQLFKARCSSAICPFILMVEEAHNFLPETAGKSAIAKSILETIAREGRKFYAQLVLISQRPVHLSMTALSQCNSQIIMRITNPYDLNHIKATSEALTSQAMKSISTLPTGHGLVMGAALNYPLFIKVRQRLITNINGEKTLSEICKSYLKDPIIGESEKNWIDYIPSGRFDLDFFEIEE